MSERTGYGSLKGEFDVTVATNRNLVIKLTSGYPKRILTITANYGVSDNDAAAVFASGRLIVVSGRFDRHQRDEINPQSLSFPDNFPTNILFDVQLTQKQNFFDFGAYGIYSRSEEQLCVILTAPVTDGDAFPAFDRMLGFLSVTGYDESPNRENPFGDVRYK